MDEDEDFWTTYISDTPEEDAEAYGWGLGLLVIVGMGIVAVVIGLMLL